MLLVRKPVTVASRGPHRNETETETDRDGQRHRQTDRHTESAPTLCTSQKTLVGEGVRVGGVGGWLGVEPGGTTAESRPQDGWMDGMD